MVFHKHNLPRLLFTHSGIICSMTQSSALSPQHYFDWSQIDDVLLDMDGTLLYRHFDNFFFEEELPPRYAALQSLSF